MRVIRDSIGRASSLLPSALELSGLVAIVYGVWSVSRPVGMIVGGLVAVVAAYAIERRRP